MPKTIAILGASSNRAKFGNKAVRAYQKAGYEVFPVNPRAEEIEGAGVFASLEEIPGDLARISVYLPPAVTREMLPAIAAKGAQEVWFNPGAAGPQVIQEAERLGISVRDGCSIVDLGMSPAEFPD